MMSSTRQSAGILLYRRLKGGQTEVLLVHPGGPYHADKDTGAWSIPKGEFTEAEAPLEAALREFREELGSAAPAGDLIALQPVRQKGGKRVLAWALEGNLDCSLVVSNRCRMEYPYKSGRWITIPEVDRAEWFDIHAARAKINPAQVAFLAELSEKLHLPTS